MDLAHYEIVGQLLRTPRWVVSRARHRMDGRPVLLKTGLGTPSSGRSADLEREFDLLRRLPLSGIPRAIELVRGATGECLVLEDSGFSPLSTRLASGQPTLEAFFSLAIELCTIAHGLHRRDLIHGSLNPAAILVGDRFDEVQLFDFALAQRAPIDAQAMASALLASGGAAYMAPEQTGRINRTVDHRADLYALGATLYEVLTGRSPFGGDDPLELVHSHIARTPLAPSVLAASVPDHVSRIVMRLLAKGAEDRYQSALGLRHDLEICRREWGDTRSVRPFDLGKRDVSDRLLIPQRLYGREAALTTLMGACDDALAGRPALLLVSGYSGVGKTSFINELCRPIVQQRGYFITGKFDQVARNVPYGALIQAFRSLIRQVLAEKEERLARWRADLLRALGANGGVVAAVIPEIEFVVGKQPPPVPLDAVESQNRFRFVFQNFVGAFARPDHPLVLFLDDLQWVDAATIEFLHWLLTRSDQLPLVVIGAYRDNDVTSDHPLAIAIEQLERADARVQRLALGSLDFASLVAFLADTLRTDEAEVEELATLIRQKTDGNPFFVIQFLQTLRNDDLLSLDHARGRWTFRLDDIAAAATTDNVATFMTQRIQRLSSGAQEMLRRAACIGSTFKWQTFLTASRQGVEESTAGLAEALGAGLIRPAEGQYDLDAAGSRAGGSYTFLHDRVQQAAYALIPEDRRVAVHLDVGRQLLAECGEDVPEDRLFEIVNHLNFGADMLDDAGERLVLARLNLAAGRKAKASAAYRASLDYLQVGISVCSEDRWQTDYAVMFALHFERAESLYLAGEFDEAQHEHARLLTRASTKLDQASVHELRVTFYENRSRYAEAISASRDGLALFAMTLPDEDAAVDVALNEEREAIQGFLNGRPIASLVDLPVMTDVEIRTAMRILTLVWASVYISGNQRLTSLISATMVRLSLAHGNTEDSAYGYVTHAMTVGPIWRDFQSGYEWGELALAVNERFGDTRRRAKIHQQIHAHVKLWRQPFEACIPHAREAMRSGLEAGDLAYAGYGAATESWPALPANRDLSKFVRDFSPALALLTKINMTGFRDALSIMLNWALALQGRTAGRLSLSSDLIDEAAFIVRYETTAPLFMTIQRWAKLHLCVVFEEIELGVEAAELAWKTTIPGTIWPVLQDFWGALALAAASSTADENGRRASRTRIASAEASLRELDKHCPENFRCFWLIVAAELSRLDGDNNEAVRLYREAISYAEVTDNVQQRALANELCARALISSGDASAAVEYLGRAYQCYAEWGALAKLRQLEDRYGHLLVRVNVAPGEPPADRYRADATALAASLDVGSVLKVAHAIAGEIEVDGLLRKLMTIALETAGAERGVFFRVQDDDVESVVEAVAENDRVVVRRSETGADAGALVNGVVRYVRRTRQDLVIGHVSTDERFAVHAAQSSASVQSVLCVPVGQQGRLSGILYLEHALSEAFTPARTEIVRVLAAQTAISLENARLYEGLKSEVARRTDAEQALRAAVSELEALKNRLEAENVYLQEEIRTQHNFEEIVGNSRELLDALRKVERVAPTDTTVLIVGETGAGKELFARAVHSRSQRSSRPLVKVNCGAIAPGLVESELFGHVKGAFTGAIDKRIGRFELASGGTIFLDEVGELPLEAQVKLLRVLQEQEFEPVGSSRSVRVNVRVIAATNRNLEQEVSVGRFRPDLYYRLNVLPILVPSLRERRADVPQLVMFFVQRHAKRIGRLVEGISRESMERLVNYAWPGNVRELENVIERALVLSPGGVLDIGRDLLPTVAATEARYVTAVRPLRPALSAPVAAPRAESGTLEDVERAHIVATLEQTGWVIEGPRGAARILDMHPNTLRSRMKKLGVERSRHEIS